MSDVLNDRRFNSIAALTSTTLAVDQNTLAKGMRTTPTGTSSMAVTELHISMDPPSS